MIPSITTSNHYPPIILLFIMGTLIISTRSAITVGDTHISTSRDSSRTSICAFHSATYSQEEISKAKSALGTYSYLSTKQIQNLLYDKNFLQIKNEMIIQTAPHIIAFITALILWLPLCCCCVWPQKHPVCKRCRKNEKEVYHRCQLKWTSYFTIVFFVVVVIGAILGIMMGTNIVNYFNDVGCKFAAFGDDLINGRLSPTVSNRFFVGLTPFSTDLTTFKTNFNTIQTQTSNSLTTAGTVRTNQANYQININSTYTNYLDIIYTNAFKEATGTTYQVIPSQFKEMFYGPTSDSTKILGSIYTSSDVIFTQINNILDPMIASWGRLSTTTSSGVTNQMTATSTSITSLKSSINSYINSIFKLFYNNELYTQTIFGLKLLFGLFLGLSILGLIAAVLIAFCSVVRARLIMYFTCIGMYLLSIISFVMLIFISLIGPNLSQICAYVDTKISTGAGTQDFFTKLGFSELGNLTKNCMSDGNGWMINEIQPTFNSTFADLVLITKNAQIFNLVIPAYSTSNINTPITEGAAKVTKIINAELLDVNSTVALNYLQALRLGALPNTNCDITNVVGDSWMPSYALYSCPGGKGQNTPCLNLANFAICPLGCYEIMSQLLSTAGDSSYVTNLATRYGGNTCTYYLYIKNLHQNWNIPRKAKLDTVSTSITTIQNLATIYDNSFKDIQSRISSFKSILETNYNQEANLTSGTFNGMDCRVIGQSIVDLRNSICVGLLGSINENFVIFLLLSYGCLLVACFATCTGVRHFKHLQKMSIHTGYKGVPVTISSQRFFQKSA